VTPEGPRGIIVIKQKNGEKLRQGRRILHEDESTYEGSWWKLAGGHIIWVLIKRGKKD